MTKKVIFLTLLLLAGCASQEPKMTEVAIGGDNQDCGAFAKASYDIMVNRTRGVPEDEAFLYLDTEDLSQERINKLPVLIDTMYDIPISHLSNGANIAFVSNAIYMKCNQ